MDRINAAIGLIQSFLSSVEPYAAYLTKSRCRIQAASTGLEREFKQGFKLSPIPARGFPIARWNFCSNETPRV